jgi:hypothetical protein
LKVSRITMSAKNYDPSSNLIYTNYACDIGTSKHVHKLYTRAALDRQGNERGGPIIGSAINDNYRAVRVWASIHNSTIS